jgi:hypothetical protein
VEVEVPRIDAESLGEFTVRERTFIGGSEGFEDAKP